MCISFPARVIAIEAGNAVVEIDGHRRRASLILVPETAVGDWVVVGVGTVLERLDARSANEMQGLVREATSPPRPSQGGRHVHAS
jgi:hydrogenase expression/formation protein HypC